MSARITVFVVDGDASVRRAMARLMRADGFRTVCVGSIEDLLQEEVPASETVLLVDVTTARPSLHTLHERLRARGLNPPVIYVTDCETDRSRSEARRTGAAGYFRKPVDEQALSDAISFAAEQPAAKPPHESPGFNQ